MSETTFQKAIDQEFLKQINEYKKILEQSKGQIIFYGPPGTGKTFVAKALANLIVPGPKIWTNSRRRKIVQFHPSYSYEDFVQGIKPVKKGSEIDYQVKPGIFQKFCQATRLPNMTWRTAAIYVLHKNGPMHRTKISKISIELEIGPAGWHGATPVETQARDITEDMRDNGEDSIFQRKKDEHGNPVPGTYELNVNSPNYQTEIDRLPESVIDNSPKVLIIDEINRGNLSKIFGELIYALEYRDEEIDLQYKEFDEASEFGTLTVPKNLFLVGTMNTADRSIVLFDAALRRRFAFIPLYPNYNLLAQSLDIYKEFDPTEFNRLYTTSTDKDFRNKIISIVALRKINEKLAANHSIGKEKQIGHTFLMPLQKHPELFEQIWKQEILPLLEEYYFETPKDIEVLFGPDVYSVGTGILKFDEAKLQSALDTLAWNP